MPPPPEVAAGIVEQPHIDGGPTAHPELDAQEVKRLALRGVGALTLRTLAQRILMMVGNIVLARLLAPETFGLYAIVSFVVGIGAFVADLGIGAALIQRRERLTDADERTAFTLGVATNGAIFIALAASAPLIVRAYGLAGTHATAVRVLALSVLVATLSMVPQARLERRLRFRELSIAELGAQATYLGVTLPLAFAGYGVWSFVWGTLVSRMVQVLVVNAASPWVPTLGIDRGRARGMLAFGLPYQMNGFVNAAKDNFIPTFVAAVAGPASVGYVTWAVGLATNALFLMPIVGRVTFPAYARLQHDREALRRSIEGSIRWVAATVFPTTLLLAALARQIVEHVYGPKWAPGLASFYLLCIPMLNAAYSTVMVSALYALGRARVVLRLTAIWAAAGWALGVPLTLWLGRDGFAAAMSIVSWLSILTVREMNKVCKVSFVRPLLRTLVLAAIPAIPIAAFGRHVIHDPWSLAGIGAAGVAGYVVLMLAFGELGQLVRAWRASRRPAPVPRKEVAAEGA